MPRSRPGLHQRASTARPPRERGWCSSKDSSPTNPARIARQGTPATVTSAWPFEGSASASIGSSVRARQQVARLRAGHVDGAVHRGLVHERHAEVPAVGPVAEPGLHLVGAARRGCDVVAAVLERAHEPVVHHVPGLVQRQEVAGAPGGQVPDPAGEHAIEQLGRVAARRGGTCPACRRPSGSRARAPRGTPPAGRRSGRGAPSCPDQSRCAPAARCVSCSAVRFSITSLMPPARSSRATVLAGGREVVRAPAVSDPEPCRANAARCRPHIAPWHGPIVAVV